MFELPLLAAGERPRIPGNVTSPFGVQPLNRWGSVLSDIASQALDRVLFKILLFCGLGQELYRTVWWTQEPPAAVPVPPHIIAANLVRTPA